MDYNISMTLTGHRNSSNNYVLNGKIMLFTVIVLFIVIAILVCFRTYVKWLFNRRGRRARHFLFFPSSSSSATTNTTTSNTNQALDLCILKTIPTFIYSSTAHQEQPLECAVCLSEFEKKEKGRVLPKCNHVFHVDCIDMWFQSHSNCPLCRAPVQPGNPVQPPVISDEEAVSVTEPASSVGEREETEVGCSSHNLPPWELVSVFVEVPRGSFRDLDDTGLGSTERSGFKSAGNRVISLKRIWSV